MDFMTWFLNALHGALGGTKKKPCEEENRGVGKCSILNCYVIIYAVKVLDVIFDRYLGQFYIYIKKCFPFTKVELSLAF